MFYKIFFVLIALSSIGYLVLDSIHIFKKTKYFTHEKADFWKNSESTHGINATKFGIPFIMLDIIWLLLIVGMLYLYI